MNTEINNMIHDAENDDNIPEQTLFVLLSYCSLWFSNNIKKSLSLLVILLLSCSKLWTKINLIILMHLNSG